MLRRREEEEPGRRGGKNNTFERSSDDGGIGLQGTGCAEKLRLLAGNWCLLVVVVGRAPAGMYKALAAARLVNLGPPSRGEKWVLLGLARDFLYAENMIHEYKAFLRRL